jgi:hypothetical protein
VTTNRVRAIERQGKQENSKLRWSFNIVKAKQDVVEAQADEAAEAESRLKHMVDVTQRRQQAEAELAYASHGQQYTTVCEIAELALKTL